MRCIALLCYDVMAIIGQTNQLDTLRQHIVTVYIFDSTRMINDDVSAAEDVIQLCKAEGITLVLFSKRYEYVAQLTSRDVPEC